MRSGGFFVVALAVVLPLHAAAQEEIVLRGNQAYQEGAYPAAIEAYEAVRDAGYTSAGLEYNLGNAYFKTGELGRAILHWERAIELDPGDADARANLELARGLTTDAIEPLPEFWLFSLVGWWIDLVPRTLLLRWSHSVGSAAREASSLALSHAATGGGASARGWHPLVG